MVASEAYIYIYINPHPLFFYLLFYFLPGTTNDRFKGVSGTEQECALLKAALKHIEHGHQMYGIMGDHYVLLLGFIPNQRFVVKFCADSTKVLGVKHQVTYYNLQKSFE